MNKKQDRIPILYRFSEIPQNEANSTTSAPIIQHPTITDEPSYKVDVLQPAPSPLPRSALHTPAASHAPTPRSEPLPTTRILTVSEVATIFIKSLVQSAADFLGKKIEGAVISVPADFSENQRKALEKAAEDADVHVLQLLDEAAAAVATTTAADWSGRVDRTELLVDVGASSTGLTLLSVREGLAYVLAASSVPSVGANQIDDKLIKFFATEFTKKTKTPLAVCPSSSPVDARAEAKLRLAIEHTKRTISASPGAATCSVESLKEGLDFTGAINRMRFDMLAAPIYASISTTITSLLESAAVDPHDVDEVVYVGGTGALPGLDERVSLAVGLREDVETPFARGTVTGGGVGDPTTILARGCAVQASLIESLAISEAPEDKELLDAFAPGHKAREVRATTRTIGALFPDSTPENKEVGGTWVPVVQKETALPARRVVSLDVALSGADGRVVVELWEAKEGIRVEKVVESRTPSEEDDEDEDEEPEEIEVKHRTVSKTTLLAAFDVKAKLGVQTKGKGPDAGKWFTRVEVGVVVGIDGDLEVSLSEVGAGGVSESVKVPAL